MQHARLPPDSSARGRRVGAVLALLLGIAVFLIALMALPVPSHSSSTAAGAWVYPPGSRVLTYILRLVLCYGVALAALSVWTLASSSRLACWLCAATASFGAFLTCSAVLSDLGGLALVLLPPFLATTLLLVRAGSARSRMRAIA